MKAFFKKSKIYSKFVQEKEDELKEDQENKKVQKELDSMQHNFNSLIQRFNSLEDVVHLQNVNSIKL
jgi:hypothetical protein|tara:strand:- start:21 stop:221 length:201 start_codon:yes stop_codon:yes gene_type:complete